MGIDKFLLLTIKVNRRVQEILRAPFLISSFLGLFLMLACSFGCAPSSSPSEGKQSSTESVSNDLPELTEELIRERINYTWVREVPEENGAGEPISWSFDEDEPKEIVVVEKQAEGTHAKVVLDVKTRSSPRTRNPRSLAGQIRTEWELKTGWALRQWEIVNTENISMKYKNIPKPPEQNSNR